MVICLAACSREPAEAENSAVEPSGPKIVTVIACSDHCDAPLDSYRRRVYEGVTDAQECATLGGYTFTVVGWGTQEYCGVIEDLEPASQEL